VSNADGHRAGEERLAGDGDRAADPAGRVGDPDEDRGLARERTSLAWTRTALSFGAAGGVIVKSHVIIGLVILGIAPVIWQLGRLTMQEPLERMPGRIKLITGTVVAVSVIALVVAFLGPGTPLRLQ
jgi:uncharacterized membrane protein YidH (DUF202 family)